MEMAQALPDRPRHRPAVFGVIVVALVTLLAGCDASQDAEAAACAQAEHAFLEVGEFRRAVDLFTECIEKRELSSSALATAYLYRGLARYRLGDPGAALVDLASAIDAHPGGENHVYALGAGGHILGILGDYPEAIESFDDAIELNSTLAPLFFGRGLTYFAIGDYDRAQRDILESQRLRPDRSTDAIWLYLSRSRGGARDPQYLRELELVASQSPRYAPIVDLFAGRRTADMVLADQLHRAATDDRLGRCDTLIYVAEHLILQGSDVRAVELLKEAESVSSHDCIAVPVLQAELRRFGTAE